MDPRFQQWQHFRPSRNRVQPAQPQKKQEHFSFVRPIPKPNKWQSTKQTRAKKGCCGGRNVTQ